MHMLTKRMLGCLAVTGALALSLAPAAYAAGEPGEGSASVADPVSAQVVEAEGDGAAPQAENDVARIGDVTYDTLDDAIAAATDGATIELLDDAQVTITLNKTMTIDGNGHVLTSKDVRYGFGVAGKTVHLTLKNMTANFSYTIEVENPGYTSDLSLFYINANTDFTFENVTMNMDGSGASNRLHGFYYDGGSTGTFELTNSELNIKNFPEDGFEWSGSSSNMNLVNSTYCSDNNRSGFAGTFNVNAKDSNIYVNNSTGNGSNGSNFNLVNSIVDFSDNGSHGLSAGTLVIDDSTVTANRNGGNGIHTSASLSIKNDSDVTISGNKCSISSQWTIPGALYIGSGESSIADSTVTIVDNNGSGIYQKAQNGSLDVENSATVTVEGNATAKCNTGTAGGVESFGGGIYVNGTVALGSGVTLYNNHAVTGGDDIYCAQTGKVTFAQTGSVWRLDGKRLAGYEGNEAVYEPADCTDTIDGWYDDSADARWEAHADSYDGIHVEEYTFVDDTTTTVTGPLALKAAHGLGVVAVDPADITIYMGGDEGYEGTATDDGAIAGSNALPEPGFYFVLPNDINQAFADAGIAGLDEAADLSQYMTIYTHGYDGEGGELHWRLEKYGENNSEAYGKFIYRIVPDPTDGQEAVPVRLQFTGDDGTSVTSDEFDPSSAGTLSKTYEMKLYTELVNNDQVVFEVDINGEKYYNSMELQTGTLNVRYVTGSQDSVMSDVLSSEEELAAARAESPDSAFALLPEGTVYYVNDSLVDIADGVAPSLLFDDVVSDHNTTGADDYDQQLANRAAEVAVANGADFENPYYQAKYLDLVDVNNGNVWLTASEPVTVYWPYPEGTDEGTEFHLVHFPDLDRTMANGDIPGAIAGSATEYAAVKNTEHGIRFTTDGFSPFVLIWDAGSEAGPQPEPPMKPAGNKNDGGLAKTGDDTSFVGVAAAAAAGIALVGAGVVASKRRG